MPLYFPTTLTPRPLSETPPIKAISANQMPANLKTQTDWQPESVSMEAYFNHTRGKKHNYDKLKLWYTKSCLWDENSKLWFKVNYDVKSQTFYVIIILTFYHKCDLGCHNYDVLCHIQDLSKHDFFLMWRMWASDWLFFKYIWSYNIHSVQDIRYYRQVVIIVLGSDWLRNP